MTPPTPARCCRWLLAVLFLLGLCACGTHNSENMPVPGESFPKRSLLGKPVDGKAAETGTPGVKGKDDSTQVYKDMDERNARFNERLRAITASARQQSQARGAKAGTREERAAPGAKTEKFTLDLFDADLIDVIRLFFSVLEENYTVSDKVGGKVTLHVDDSYTREQLVDLLQGVLRMQGATMFKSGGIWQVMTLGEAPASVDASSVLAPDEGVRAARGQTVQAFRLRFMPASELVNVIKPYMSNAALIYANDQAGVLLVSDYPNSLAKVSKMIEMFDISVFADLKLKVYSLKHVSAQDLAAELNGISSGAGLGADTKGLSGVSVMPMDRLNMLLVMTRNPQSLAFVDTWIQELDRDAPLVVRSDLAEDIHVYYAQNGDAKEIATALEGIFGSGPQKTGTATGTSSRRTEPAANRTTAARGGQGIGASAGRTSGLASSSGLGSSSGGGLGGGSGLGSKGGGGLGSSGSGLGSQSGTGPSGPVAGQLGGAAPTPGLPVESLAAKEASPAKLTGVVNFVVDETTNAIIVRSNGSDWRKIERVIERLDIYPKQVLIEVVIAEVSLDDATKLGVDWQKLFNLRGADTLSVRSSTGIDKLIGSGLSVVYAADSLTATLKAFAQDNRVHILSSPQILASNHKEAKINVGEEVPIVTSELRTNEATSTATTVDKTIQYRDTGIILTVKPHINDKGLVRMDISQEVSSISEKTVQGVNSPIFNNRTATSTLVVNSEQTVVIGGLIQHTLAYNNNGIPGVSKVPFLKYFFGYESDSFRGSELLIFITPHVIESKEDGDVLSRGFLNRLETIKAHFR